MATIAAIAPMMTGLITAPITTRAIGAVGRGFVATGLTWTSSLALLFCLSLGQIAVSIASRRCENRRFSEYAGTLLIITAAATVAAWLTLLFVWAGSGQSIFGETPPWVIIGLSVNIPFFLWNYVAVGLIQIRGLIKQLAKLSLLSTAIGVALTIILVPILNLGVLGVVISIGAGNAILAVFQLKLILKNRDGALTANWPLARALVSGGLRLHPNAIGVFLIAHSDILLLAHYGSAQDVGWYQFAVVLTGPLMLVPQSMASSMYSLVARVGADAAWRHQRLALFQITGLTAVGALVGLALAPWVVVLIGGDGFAASAILLQILLVAAPLKAIPTLLAPQFVARGMFIKVSAVAVLAGVLNVGLNVWAIPRWGAPAAAWTTVIAYAFTMSAALLMARRLPSGETQVAESPITAAVET